MCKAEVEPDNLSFLAERLRRAYANRPPRRLRPDPALHDEYPAADSVTGGGAGRGPKSHSDAIEDWAREALRRDPSPDHVVAGHSHAPVNIEVDNGRYYVNAGDWITPVTFATIPADGSPPVIRRWTAAGSIVSTQYSRTELAEDATHYLMGGSATAI